jgi:hypothetical protein
MEAGCSQKTLVFNYKTIRCQNPEDHSLKPNDVRSWLSIPGVGKNFLSSSLCPDLLWVHPASSQMDLLSSKQSSTDYDQI